MNGDGQGGLKFYCLKKMIILLVIFTDSVETFPGLTYLMTTNIKSLQGHKLIKKHVIKFFGWDLACHVTACLDVYIFTFLTILLLKCKLRVFLSTKFI